MGGYVLYYLGEYIYFIQKENGSVSSTSIRSISAVFAGMFIAQLSIVSHILVSVFPDTLAQFLQCICAYAIKCNQ